MAINHWRRRCDGGPGMNWDDRITRNASVFSTIDQVLVVRISEYLRPVLFSVINNYFCRWRMDTQAKCYTELRQNCDSTCLIEVMKKVVMHLQSWSPAALIGEAANVSWVQVNQSCSLNTEPREHVFPKTCLLARPPSGTLFLFCFFHSLSYMRDWFGLPLEWWQTW